MRKPRGDRVGVGGLDDPGPRFQPSPQITSRQAASSDAVAAACVCEARATIRKARNPKLVIAKRLGSPECFHRVVDQVITNSQKRKNGMEREKQMYVKAPWLINLTDFPGNL